MNSDNTSNAGTLSRSAIWALERLAEIRYGRETPALGWSVTRELISAGFVAYAANGRSGVSITAAGKAFVQSLK
ncbi:hypothetical protein LIG30_2366 [Burkholderia sp. lig30]|jgi:hypothetical protein|uniref:hypothetical protein n=1 Tax=Burkholderia sp. lig30 TaxID=1192124 RepID=UPI000461E2D7|nr:hypothetical protein [Burkholderia sp. lig30]KDB08567.1 hypothetical protein LIG30_2366 [Burkholderia sp. lig30]